MKSNLIEALIAEGAVLPPAALALLKKGKKPTFLEAVNDHSPLEPEEQIKMMSYLLGIYQVWLDDDDIPEEVKESWWYPYLREIEEKDILGYIRTILKKPRKPRVQKVEEVSDEPF